MPICRLNNCVCVIVLRRKPTEEEENEKLVDAMLREAEEGMPFSTNPSMTVSYKFDRQ